MFNEYSAIAWDRGMPGDVVEDDVFMHPSCTGLLRNVGSSTMEKYEPLMDSCSAWPKPKLNTKIGLHTTHHHHPPQGTF